MPKDVDYAWAAGIIDGEGYVGMTVSPIGTNRRTTVGYQIRISVRMTHENTIRRLYGIFGGTVKLSPARDKLKHKDSHEWYSSDLLTVEVLRRVLPYLTTKRDQAVLLLEYREVCFAIPIKGRGAACPPEMAKIRTSYYDRLKKLNKKGPS